MREIDFLFLHVYSVLLETLLTVKKCSVGLIEAAGKTVKRGRENGSLCGDQQQHGAAHNITGGRQGASG